MIIRFLDKQYEVLLKIKSTDFLDLCIAKDLKGPDLYTVARVKDRELIRQLIPLTNRKNALYTFQDLHDSFNADGNYYILFHHARGQTLQQAMQENAYHLKERLLLMKNILSRIFILNMPDCFLYEALRKDSIVVDEAMGVRFNYFFTEVDYYGQVGERHCLRRICDLVQELFCREAVEKSAPELEEFVRNLEKERFESIWDCYAAFDSLYDRLRQKSEDHGLRPRRIWWRAWDWLKEKAAVIKATLAVALILAAGAYLLFHLPNPVLSEDGIAFQKIGTLEIEEQIK